MFAYFFGMPSLHLFIYTLLLCIRYFVLSTSSLLCLLYKPVNPNLIAGMQLVFLVTKKQTNKQKQFITIYLTSLQVTGGEMLFNPASNEPDNQDYFYLVVGQTYHVSCHYH